MAGLLRMRPEKDRNYISWLVLLRGFVARHRRCTLCGSRNVSRSHTPFHAPGPALGLVAMRCRACGKRFSLRQTVVGANRRSTPETP